MDVCDGFIVEMISETVVLIAWMGTSTLSFELSAIPFGDVSPCLIDAMIAETVFQYTKSMTGILGLELFAIACCRCLFLPRRRRAIGDLRSGRLDGYFYSRLRDRCDGMLWMFDLASSMK